MTTLQDVHYRCSSCERRFSICGMTEKEIGPITPEKVAVVGYDVRCPVCRSPNPILMVITNANFDPIRNLNAGDTLDITVPEGKVILLKLHTRKAP